MARRIEVELTSSRDDGTWTWRAAGARQPKGELDGGLLYDGAKAGDVVKVEAEFHLDGIEVTTVFPPKEAKSRPDVLPLVSRPLRDDELVTTTRAPRREGGRGDDRRRGPRREGGPRGEGDGRREGRREGAAGDRERRRRDQPEQEARPKPRRLRPRRVHRDAVVAEVPEEYRPIAQRLLSGGIPEVRKALDEQNAAARAEGGPELAPGPILAIAEDLFPKLRTAEWRDRADAALAELDELDLRDLRSVVVASDAAARDDETRGLAEQLRQGLNRRVEADHEQWMQDLTGAVNEGRVVRALRLSSRPVKAGAPLPAELAATLAEMTADALTSDISQDRWATVLDAVAYSPVRAAVTPAGIPAEPSPELREAVTKVADRVPHIAGLFGIDPAEAARGRARTRRPRTRKPEGDRPGGQRPGGRGGAAAPSSAPEGTGATDAAPAPGTTAGSETGAAGQPDTPSATAGVAETSEAAGLATAGGEGVPVDAAVGAETADAAPEAQEGPQDAAAARPAAPDVAPSQVQGGDGEHDAAHPPEADQFDEELGGLPGAPAQGAPAAGSVEQEPPSPDTDAEAARSATPDAPTAEPPTAEPPTAEPPTAEVPAAEATGAAAGGSVAETGSGPDPATDPVAEAGEDTDTPQH